MFQFTGLLLHSYEFTMQYLRITIGEFPHSEISGSKYTYYSPKHFAVCRVLHQLLVPRHPPCALSNLITICYFPNLIEINFNKHILLKYMIYHNYQVFKELFLERIISQN